MHILEFKTPKDGKVSINAEQIVSFRPGRLYPGDRGSNSHTLVETVNGRVDCLDISYDDFKQQMADFESVRPTTNVYISNESD